MGRNKLEDINKKKKTGITVNIDLIDIMDEYLEEIGNSNRSRYVEKLIEEDLQKRGIIINKKF
jgi:metal-responsive CopG/Arc/MetJ family transcriptional regulator